MKTVKITKMQGCGNDFVIMDYCEYEKTGMKMEELAKKICNRNFGVGADGLIIPKVNVQSGDIGWYFYNSDGSTAQMCGNGMRCFVRYLYDNKIVNKKQMSIETDAGIIKCELLEDTMVKVNIGKPIFEDIKIPFFGERKFQILDREFEIMPISVGNPHCVIFTDEDPMELAQKYGPYIESHEFFPERTNTEFVKVRSRREIDMRVYERGCGITQACGTGACVSVVACILNNLTESKVKVNLLGGPVFVEWQGNKDNLEEDIYLIGSAEYSFWADYML